MIHSAIHSRTQKSARTPVSLKIQVWWVKANPCHNAWGQLTGPASLDFFELCQRNLLTQKKLCEYSRKHQGGVRSAQWLHHKIHSKQPYNMCFEILVLPCPAEGWGVPLWCLSTLSLPISPVLCSPRWSPHPQSWSSSTSRATCKRTQLHSGICSEIQLSPAPVPPVISNPIWGLTWAFFFPELSF